MNFTRLLLFILSVFNGISVYAESSKILLINDDAVLYRPGTFRRLHQLNRHSGNPVIKVDKPWEGLLSYCTLYKDADSNEYKMWYQSHGGGCNVCYAVSKDGLNWTKPELDIYPYQNAKTNIVMNNRHGYGASVIVERDSGPRKYKMAYWDMPNMYEQPWPGLYVAFSEDGIHWKKYEGNPVLKGAYGKSTEVPFQGDPNYGWGVPNSVSDVIDLTYVPQMKKYIIYAKSWIDAPDGKTYWKRSVTRTESNDFVKWSRPELVMYPDDFDGQFPAKYGGSRTGVQLHAGPVFYYSGFWFSLLQVIDFETSGEMPIELAMSKNGQTWSRPFRKELLLDVSHDNSFDSGRIWSSSTPILLENEFRFYYGGYNTPWNSTSGTITGIGFATMPRDRFAGVRPIYEIGQITFKPIKLDGRSKIRLNADAEGGSVDCELFNKDGYRIKGYAARDCASMTSNSLDFAVSWSKPLSELASGEYMLRLHLKNAEVFAITVCDK